MSSWLCLWALFGWSLWPHQRSVLPHTRKPLLKAWGPPALILRENTAHYSSQLLISLCHHYSKKQSTLRPHLIRDYFLSCGEQWNIIVGVDFRLYVCHNIFFLLFGLYKSCKATHKHKEGWKILRTLKGRVKVWFTLEMLMDALTIVFVESSSASWKRWCGKEISLHSPSQCL